MSGHSLAARDSITMLRRNLRHARRYPSMTVSIVALPVVMLLLFVYVFGGTIGAGLGGTSAGANYIDYITPGIVLLALSSGSVSTAVAVSVDMTEGIISRFRTMPIARGSVLTGHVVGSVLQAVLSTGLVVAVAAVLGFRPNASAVEWVAVLGVVAMVAFAVTWLSVAIGLASGSPEAASNAVLPLQLLPFVGSAIVPTQSMPAGLRWFAEHQPFTPVIETLRGLLLGTPVGGSAVTAAVWCAGGALVGYLWARHAFARGTPG